MVDYKNVFIRKEDNAYITDGLLSAIGNEIKIIAKEKSEDDYVSIMCYLIDYVLQETPRILNGHTIAHFSWLLQFVESDGYYVMGEAKVNGDGFCEGVDYSIGVLNSQMDECRVCNVSPVFPTFSQNIVISKGVYEGLAVDGVRYSSPPHMTGWWLTTELFESDINTLMNVHYFHVAFKRPDILKFLALPNGFRFYVGQEEQGAWFDKEVD